MTRTVRPRCPERHPKSGEQCLLNAGHVGSHKLDPTVHRCHAVECTVPVKPEMLMCAKHWRKVPRQLQRAVWKAYRVGQCDDKRPSRDWLAAADAAIKAVARAEGLLREET